jgi:mannose-1-phosphate guanylyltransferase
MAINIVHEPELLGSGGTLAANQAFVAGEKDYWIFYADTLIGADLRPLVALHRENQADLTLALFRSPNPSSGGVVEIDQSGAILSFEEKPLHPKSNLVAAGAYLAGPALLHYLTPGFSDLSRDVFPRLMGHARARLLDPVIDLGTPDSYARAQKEWMSFGLND